MEIRARIEEDADRFATARIVRTGCGGADLDREVDLSGVYVDSNQVFAPEAILRLPDLLLAQQEIFRVSGGAHGAGLFDADGNVLVVKEDVGRHNAVDKVLGYLLMSGGSPRDKGMILSGRLSYEMVLKAARAGVPLVCSVSAPTALGVEVGRKTGVTMVGFLRGAGFNVYSHPSRIGGT
jgi:FdhD protein